MPKGVETVLKIEDDSDLCNEIYKLILKHYGPKLDLTKCKDKDQVVLLVWHVHGIIGNGGFRYLFEGDLPGDPTLAKTLNAYRAIKATRCVVAFEAALGLFPNSELPANVDERLHAYLSVKPAKRNPIDKKFWDGGKDVGSHLAKYIRENRADFSHLG
jgi:hypothetical protein